MRNKITTYVMDIFSKMVNVNNREYTLLFNTKSLVGETVLSLDIQLLSYVSINKSYLNILEWLGILKVKHTFTLYKCRGILKNCSEIDSFDIKESFDGINSYFHIDELVLEEGELLYIKSNTLSLISFKVIVICDGKTEKSLYEYTQEKETINDGQRVPVIVIN